MTGGHNGSQQGRQTHENLPPSRDCGEGGGLLHGLANEAKIFKRSAGEEPAARGNIPAAGAMLQHEENLAPE